MQANLLHERASGDIEVDVPKYLDLRYAMYICFCCCRKKVTAFEEYKEAIKMGESANDQDLDVIRFVRR
jgi:hypothetical protein